MEKDRDASALRAAADFLRRFGLQALAVSAGLLIPCFWHRRIEAGDLGSHVYNAWLAQLIERGQAPGLYLARQWNNVLFGFFNYYLSLGFGFFATAIVWSGRGKGLILVAPLAALALIAHPQGFVWLVGCIGYVVLWRVFPGTWKLAVPGAAILVVVVARRYLVSHYEAFAV